MKVSIITVCRNVENCIENTIQSVLGQTYPDIEYVLIDGASTDGTMNIINKYRNRIKKIVSEPDKGIYDAMNKGIVIAGGDILYFLNADDRIFDNTVIQVVVNEFLLSKADIVYGKAMYSNIPQKVALTFNTKNVQRDSLRDLVLKERVPQQCYFMHRRTFDKVGNFNDCYSVAADYDWLFRAMNSGMKFKFLDQWVVNFYPGGASYQKRYPAIQEIIKIVFRNTSIFLFLEYAVIALFRKLVHIFLEEIITPIYQLFRKA